MGRMGRLTAGLLAGLALVSACGSGSGEPSASPTTPSETAAPGGAGRDGLRGADAVGDLSSFRCEPDDDGRWEASGFITNPTDRTASYAVTVVVSGADIRDAQGRQRILPALPGAQTPFAIANVPMGDGVDPTCSVRVVRLR